VIVPVFNVERYVAQAVESALGQSHPDVQVVVVNDGSTDGSVDALAPYRDRIVYVEQANRGLAGTRNRALREATGEYVALLDADDVWLPDRLERMVSHLEGHPEVGFVTSDAFFMHEDEPSDVRYYEHFDFLLQGDPFGTGDQRYWILFHNFVMGMTVVRRALFERHGYFEESLRTSEDWDLWIRFIFAGERAGLVNEPLCYYRIRADSLSADRHRVYHDALRVLERAVSGLGRDDLVGLAKPLLRRGKHALALGDHHRAAAFFAAAGRDPRLPWRKRMEALAFATAPGIGGRVWSWKARRDQQRAGTA
jgi:glycosyltransferase involved in cell wall biosynthesis